MYRRMQDGIALSYNRLGGRGVCGSLDGWTTTTSQSPLTSPAVVQMEKESEVGFRKAEVKVTALHQ